MKRIIISLLMSLVLVQSSGNFLLIAEYHLNKDYITKELCINKSSPWLNCKGNCQLKKSLQQENNEEIPTRKLNKTNLQQAFYFDVLETWNLGDISLISFIFHLHPKLNYYSAPVTSIFHPPA